MYVCFMHFFNHFYSSIFEIALWITAHSSPYIAHERTAPKFDFVSLLRALRSLSQGAPSLQKWRFAQERRAIERYAQLCCVYNYLPPQCDCLHCPIHIQLEIEKFSRNRVGIGSCLGSMPTWNWFRRWNQFHGIDAKFLKSLKIWPQNLGSPERLSSWDEKKIHQTEMDQ